MQESLISHNITPMITRLSVNVNKIALLRNSRGNDLPNLIQCVKDIEAFGAQGITVHPRPDGRHIRKSDVLEIPKHINCEFNIEGYPSEDFIELIHQVKPHQVTLVPDPPEALTSNAGWRLPQSDVMLASAIDQLRSSGSRIAIFIDPFDYLESSCEEIAKTGADRIELYTESYAKAFGTKKQTQVVESYRKVALRCLDLGLGINAGHDLNLQNLHSFTNSLGCIAEVSIGHALISEALYLGLEETIKRYRKALSE